MLELMKSDDDPDAGVESDVSEPVVNWAGEWLSSRHHYLQRWLLPADMGAVIYWPGHVGVSGFEVDRFALRLGADEWRYDGSVLISEEQLLRVIGNSPVTHLVPRARQ